MSTKRNTRLKALVKGPNGRNLCRWCGTECAQARRTFCSSECVHQYLIRARPRYARECVFDRDLGVCSECFVECGTPRDRYRRLLRLSGKAKADGDHDIAKMLSDNARALQDRYMGEPIFERRTPYFQGTPWDCDHIVPVVEGGGECGLENLRTLCRPCHKRATAALAKRRAEAKKLAR